MHLDLARPGQRRPRPGDVADLVRGGLRQHLRARGATGLADALPFAAALSVIATAALAAVFLFRVEYAPGTTFVGWARPGPFTTLGAFVWMAWLVPPVATLAGLTRPAVLLALTVTVAAVVAAPMTPYERPPLFALVPQLALGLVALAFPARPGTRSRLGTAALAAGIATPAVLLVPRTYYYSAQPVLPCTAALLTLTLGAAGIAFLARHDRRGFWPVLVLLAPMLLLSQPGWSPYPRQTMAAAVLQAAIAVTVALAGIPLTVLVRGWRHNAARRSPGVPAGPRCPACGRPT